MAPNSIFQQFGSGVYNSITATNNVTFFSGEENFRTEACVDWFAQRKYLPVYVVTAYIVVIFSGQQLMKQRKRFELQKLLILWNFGLAAFSMFAALRLIPELVYSLFGEAGGFYRSVCLLDEYENRVLGYWNMLFAFSKFIELGDTVFIVLRKQPLIFLHWYHHVTVLVFTWYAGADAAATSRWFSCVNLVIHSYMYTYYGMRALKYRIPKKIAIAITSSQLLQMVVGIYAILSARFYKNSGLPCRISDSIIYAGLGMYASYWVLFAHFFYKAYLSPKPIVKPANGVKKQN